MLTRDPAALKLLLTDELYLLKADKLRIGKPHEEKKAIKEAPGEKVEVVGSEPRTDEIAEPARPVQKPAFTGSMANGCLVLLNEPGFERLSPETETALRKIFQARKTSLNDCGLINTAHTPVTFSQIRDEIKPKTLVILGINADELKLDQPAYNSPLEINGIKILYSDKMSDILQDEARKKLFWEGLKQLV